MRARLFCARLVWITDKAALSEDVKEQLALQMLGIQKLTEGQEDFRAEVAYDVLCKVINLLCLVVYLYTVKNGSLL